ncbi:nucleotidyltransferase [Guptibacillus hwajinpoensis]|uniref:Nucleotidyltransferase n=1 Tax=Guptibacillus hwajinpoensis TaxID=208199 RepID=A0ABU0K695_9BACL|nr:nucleotidyltransferase [Alkalihalobacillus hemicentroti]MDQ0484895.1 hypothetical protein [Alkalihalobacillus hemicentroti]
MEEIKPLGSFYRVDDEGYLVNDTSWEKIDQNYRNAIKRAVEILTLAIPLSSIYLRGSVPKGNGIEGISDLDLIVLTDQDHEQVADLLNHKLTTEFPWVSGCEVSFFSLQKVERVTRFSIIPFMIKTSSLCVYGNDVANDIPRFKPDRALANEHLIQLRTHINQAKKELNGNEDEEDIADCCTWIMKIIVRSGLALVMEQKPTYTRDLYPAYTLFSSFYSYKEREMKQALIYAIVPSNYADEVIRFLNGFGEWMIQESDHWLDQYNPNRAPHMLITN